MDAPKMHSSWKWFFGIMFAVFLVFAIVEAVRTPKYRARELAICQEILVAARSRADTLLALRVPLGRWSDCEERFQIERRMKAR